MTGTLAPPGRRATPAATVVAVSHADPIKAALAHALGMHLDLFQRIASHRLGHHHRLRADGADGAGCNAAGDLAPLAAVMRSSWYARASLRPSLPATGRRPSGRVGRSGRADERVVRLLELRTTSPPARSARPASACSICRRARATPLVTLKCEKEQVRRARRVPERAPRPPVHAGDGQAAADARAVEPSTRPGSWARSASATTRTAIASCWSSRGPGAGRRRRRPRRRSRRTEVARPSGAGGRVRGGRRGRRGDRASARVASPAPRPPRSSSARAACIEAGRPTCPILRPPEDPGGHRLPPQRTATARD